MVRRISAIACPFWRCAGPRATEAIERGLFHEVAAEALEPIGARFASVWAQPGGEMFTHRLSSASAGRWQAACVSLHALQFAGKLTSTSIYRMI